MSEPDLLRAILANPYDDTPRLIYADWLEDNGQEKRAKEIRKGIESRDVTWQRIVPDGSLQFMHRRGFVAGVLASQTWFVANIEALFYEHPIVAVRLWDAIPEVSPLEKDNQESLYCRWSPYQFSQQTRPIHDQLHEGIYNRLPSHLGNPAGYYPTRKIAERAMSHACVSLGRERAGLPPLRTTKIEPYQAKC